MSKEFAVYVYKEILVAVLFVPDDVTSETAIAAWSYAVTYSAKGLNIPDYDAAVKLLKERHPNWEVRGGAFTAIKVNLAKAGDDIPEKQ